jgi:uncharacterized OB-fold protein
MTDTSRADSAYDMEPFNLQFPFTRTLGSTLSTFFSALAEGQLIGVKVGGRVIAPPLEYDPDTGADAGSDWVKVGPKGTVSTWTWVSQPTNLHPLQEPFAFAFITLDGADTPMIHAVQCSEDQLQSGLRVEAQFKPAGEANGRIDDIVAFVPATDPAPSVGAGEAYSAPAEPEVQTMDSFCDLVYVDNAAPATRKWVEGLLAGKLYGRTCATCGRTFVGAIGLCCVDAVDLPESSIEEMPQTGVVTNFTVITPTPYPGQLETEPFVRCSIMLDGTDAVMGQQTIIGIPASEVRVGMHVAIEWAPEGERDVSDIGNGGHGSTGGAVVGWKSTGEPDEPAENYVDRMM